MYREKDTFLHSYFKFLARCKMIHAKVPSTDPEEIKDYVDNLNKTINFTGKDVIKVEDLDPNEIKKYHVKSSPPWAVDIARGMFHQDNCLMMPEVIEREL